MSKREKNAWLCGYIKSGNSQISYFFLLDFKARGCYAKHHEMN